MALCPIPKTKEAEPSGSERARAFRCSRNFAVTPHRYCTSIPRTLSPNIKPSDGKMASTLDGGSLLPTTVLKGEFPLLPFLRTSFRCSLFLCVKKMPNHFYGGRSTGNPATLLSCTLRPGHLGFPPTSDNLPVLHSHGKRAWANQDHHTQPPPL